MSPGQLESLLEQQRGEIESGSASRSLSDIAIDAGYVTGQQLESLLGRRPGIDVPRNLVPGFDIIERIGVGSMGSVFKARQLGLKRTVAIKLMKPESAIDATLVSRFQKEARALARLDHPNIVRAYLIGEAEGYHYLAMEYVEGEDLRELVRRGGPLSEPETAHIGMQIARALHHVHGLGIVHRDVKPSNILYVRKGGGGSEFGTAKLADLGLAMWREMEGARQTQHGYIVGTATFMAPEQVENSSETDGRSDVYALGGCLFHMLCGRSPYIGGISAQIFKHATDPVPDPREFNRAVSAGMAGIIRKAMAKRPEQRYASADQLAVDLEAILKHHELAADLPELWGCRLVSREGNGLASVVYAARQVDMARDVLVRFTPMKLLRQPGGVEARLEYMQKLGNLNERGIPHVQACGYDSRGFYTVSLRIAGRSVLSERMNETQALGLFFRIARRFRSLNDSGLCHGLPAPSCLILDNDGRPWLTNAGCLTGLAPDARAEIAEDQLLNRYLAPELARPMTEPTIASDMYSLGVILHDVLAGTEARNGMARGPMRLPNVSEPVNLLLERMTSPFPDARPANPDALISAIRTTAEDVMRSAFVSPAGARESGFVTQELPAIIDESEPGMDSASLPPVSESDYADGSVVLEIVEGPSQGRSYVLSEGEELTFGRMKGKRVISLGDTTISAPHCTFTLNSGVLTVKDRESTNGTYVNRKRCDNAALYPGSEISLGRTVIKVR